MTLKIQDFFKKISFTLLFSFIIAMNVFSQIPSNTGTDFYVAFGRNNTATTSASVELILRVTAFMENTQVNLHFAENPQTCNDSFLINTGMTYDYHLRSTQAAAAYLGAAGAAYKVSRSIRVTSNHPVTLVAVNTANADAEATLVWPVESWGTDYYNITIPPLNASHSNGFILIAKENNTHVSYYDPGSTIPINFTLNEGECYVDNVNANIMEARVVSDKPIAYFQTGSQSAIGNFHNHTFEHFLPTNQWGTKFILPTNEYGAAYAQVFAKENDTNVTVTYSSGATETFTLTTSNVNNRHKEIIINNSSVHPSENSCFINADKPVGVVAFQIPKGSEMSQPGEAWLPPLEQRVRDVLVSPLDLNGKYMYMPTKHHLSIVTPTASKNNTVISIDGGTPQPINKLPPSTFLWIEDNIGGSEYSFGRYYFGQSGPLPPNPSIFTHLNTTILVDNPDGLIAMAWGQGTYSDYFYTVGSGYKDLTSSFTVNGISYIDMDEKAYCGTPDFIFEAIPDTLTSVVWKLNGVEIPESRNETTVIQNNLSDGHYTIEMIVRDKNYTTHFWVGGSTVIWTPQIPDVVKSRNILPYQDWHNPINWTPFVVPSSCHNVIIPGDRYSYPMLEDETAAICKNIYFIQGAELGRPDLLTYEKAYVQYNFGLNQSIQQKDDDKDLILYDNTTFDRMLFSAAVSADPLAHERWYMLSSPLRKVVTGDLSFGGFPLTFLMKFGPVTKDKHYEVGEWTTPYNSMTEFVSTNSTGQYIPTGGFAFYMYGWGNPDGNDGCYETGAFNNPSMNDLTYLPDTRSEEDYGLKEMNGILELPFYADSIGLYAHRTQVYNPVTNRSTFFYINDGVKEPADFNKLSGKSEPVVREDYDGNYRFAPENDSSGNGDWTFQNPIYHSEAGLGEGDEFLVGNPYMSSIDMVEFLNDNSATILPQFRIWNGTSFISYSSDGTTITPTYPPDDAINPGYVAPLQGFFLKTVTGYSHNRSANVAKFDVTKISTTRPINNPSNLRSAGETKEENILRIKAENGAAASHTLIGYRAGANNAFVRGEDVQKLFSSLSHVPEIYSIAGETPVDINFINEGAIIPLGIKTERKGEIRLTFTGMDNYSKASKIELLDALENSTVDLTGKPSYTYTFNHTKTGIQNGRFSLRITASITGLGDISNSDDLNIYGDSNGIYVLSASSDPVQQITVYDFQGRKVYESNTNAGYYPLQGNSGHSSLIVKVTTVNTTKTVKLRAK